MICLACHVASLLVRSIATSDSHAISWCCSPSGDAHLIDRSCQLLRRAHHRRTIWTKNRDGPEGRRLASGADEGLACAVPPPTKPGLVTVPMHPGDLPIGTLRSIEKAAGINASSAWMNHFSRIRESHPIAAAVRDDDGACRFVGCVSRPVALKLQQQLYPTAQASAGLLQPAKRELVAGRCEPAARIRNVERSSGTRQCDSVVEQELP